MEHSLPGVGSFQGEGIVLVPADTVQVADRVAVDNHRPVEAVGSLAERPSRVEVAKP